MSLSFRHMLYAPLLCLSLAAAAQSPSPQADRIAARPNLRATTRLAGHVPSWANGSVVSNTVPADTPLRLTFVLTRSAERQAAFDKLLADQQTPGSPSYHHWLTPQQIGQLYGPTQHDLDALTAWLTSQGLTVTDTAPSHTFITVDASAGTVANALSVNFRSVLLNGPDGLPEAKPRITTTTEPAIPTAFVPLISAITGLSDTPVQPMVHTQGATLPSSGQPVPLLTSSGGAHYITPNDFTVLYNLAPVYNSGLNGAGQKIAILGRSRVLAADISNFAQVTAVASKQPNIIVPPAGADPGMTGNADQDEATLDVQRVLGTTPGAQADLIISTAATGGIQTAAQYNVQTLLDPVMSISFGSCEANASQSGVTFWDTLFSQAAAQGISTFVSSGDSGAAACQTSGQAPSGVQSRSMNVICSSSYATCVGGTEFADFTSPATYWSATNGPGNQSALSYIPEGAWNEPTVTSSTGVTTYVVFGTGGGASAFVTKPSWQTGTGVPIDGARDVPDVSFSSSSHNGYIGCLTYRGQTCLNGQASLFSGTSAAAPSMASIAALLNQKTGAAQGNFNPLLYRLAASAPNAFHDATPASSGVSSCSINTPGMCNNSTPSATGLTGGLAGFALTAGYDQATGLGSLDVANFLTATASSANVTLSPATRSLTLTTGSTTGNTDLITVGSSLYSGPVSLGCTVTFTGSGSASSLPICSLSPANVNVAANGSATSTLTIATSRANSAQIHVQPASPSAAITTASNTLLLGRLTLSSLALLLLLPRRRSLHALRSFRRTLPRALLLFAGLAAGLGALSACSGSSTPASPNPLLVSPTNTTLTSTASTIFAGSSGTFTTSVVNAGFNTTVAPTGTIQFFNGGSTPIATATLGAAAANTAASVTTSIPFPAPGTYTVFANYTGDKNFSASSTNIPFTVVPAGTTAGSYTVTITASGNGIPSTSTSVALTVQ